jgi:hypothetical protein
MIQMTSYVPLLKKLFAHASKPEPYAYADLVKDMQAVENARIAFHFSDASLNTPSHVEMWVDAIDAAGVEWYVICRERHHHEYFKSTGRARSVYAPVAELLEHAVGPNVRAMLYANNVQKNREMLAAREDLQHVQMLHGDSDKPPSYSPLTRNFDKVFVAGQMGRDRYTRNGIYIPDDKFVHVGRPQAALMSRGKSDKIRTAVYMPTWKGFYEDTQFSSLDRAARIIETFGRVAPDVKLVFKPHPVSYKDPDWARIEREVRAALAKIGGEFADADLSAFDAYNMADLLLTDISSTVIDYLYTGRPQILFLPQGPDLDMDQFPSLAATYQVAFNISDLDAKIYSAITDDPLANMRNKMRYYAFGDCDAEADTRFADAIRSLVHRHQHAGSSEKGTSACQTSRRKSLHKKAAKKLPRSRKPKTRCLPRLKVRCARHR